MKNALQVVVIAMGIKLNVKQENVIKKFQQKVIFLRGMSVLHVRMDV